MAVAIAKEAGNLITFDPNLRKPLWKDLEQAREQMLWGLNQADVVKISDEEVDFLFGLEPEEGAEHILRTFGVKLVFVTCGANGCYFRNAVTRGYVPALGGLKVVDTTGAGDIFGGSALWKLLQLGKQPEELSFEEARAVAAFGCTSAGLSVTRPGGISSVPDYQTVMDRLI
jgi:fructokinase